MEIFAVKWLAFILGSVAAMALGMVWYSPKAFFPVWQKAVGISDEKLKEGNPGRAMLFGLIANTLSLYFFCVLLEFTHISSLSGALGISLLVSLGLITLTEINNGSFWATKPAAYLVDGGYRALALGITALLYILL